MRNGLSAILMLAIGIARRGSVIFAMIAVAVPLLTAAGPARAGRIAMTFDDLPIFGPYVSAAESEDITTRLLAGFRRHRWPAIGFVNEIQLDAADRDARIALLRQWLDAGMDLGNHSYSHLSLTSTPVEAYIADVARGEIVTKQLLARRGRSERWFRYPYLETGPTLLVRQRFESWLSAHGYRVAPVSVENSDWQFAVPYADALAHGDLTGAAHIRDAYLQFTTAVIPWYQDAARGLLGREPSLIFLLHASRLNADCVDQLAAILKADRLRPVSLDRAMRDRAYRIADNHLGPDGDEWVTRWAETLHRNLPYDTMPMVPKDIVALDTKLETPPAVTPAAGQEH